MPWMRPASDTPFGFRPYDAIKRIRPYAVSSGAAAIYQGDVVVLDSAGQIAVGTSASTQVLGVAAQYNAASTANTSFLVYDDPNQLFYIQDDGDTTAMTATHVGNNVNLVTTTGDTATLQSKHELDSSSAGTTAGQVCKVLALHEMEGGSFATGAGAPRKWVVQFNMHLYRDVVGQTGV